MTQKIPIDDTIIKDDHNDNAIVPPLEFKPDEYKDDWLHADIDEEQLNEYLKVLWDIAQTFVLLGFNADISQIMMSHIVGISGPDSGKLLEIDNSQKENDEEESEKP